MCIRDRSGNNTLIKNYYRGHDETPTLRVIWKGTGLKSFVTKDIDVTLSDDTFYFIALALKISTGELKVVLRDTDNNDLINETTTNTSGTLVGSSLNQMLAIFSNVNNGLFAQSGILFRFNDYVSGRSQNVGIWKGKYFSDSEINDLYDNGVPLPYNASPVTNIGGIIGRQMMAINGLR